MCFQVQGLLDQICRNRIICLLFIWIFDLFFNRFDLGDFDLRRLLSVAGCIFLYRHFWTLDLYDSRYQAQKYHLFEL